jgi:single-strand DNA-binding protein
MSRSVNKATVLGNVGDDPEIKTAGTGTRIAKFSLATNEKWKDKAGQEHEKTQWHRCVAFGRVVDVIEQYVRKGDRLYIEARIEYSTSESEGGTRYWTDLVVNDLVMLGSSGATESEPSKPARSQGTGMDAELPFGNLRGEAW